MLGEFVRGLRLWRNSYADDSQLYLKLPSDLREMMERLGHTLEEVMGLIRVNSIP